jgi:hypothetical protein
MLTLTGAGSVIVKASQVGNTNYTAADEVDQSFTVNKASQRITFDPIADKHTGDAPFTISATASSGLPVSFEIVSGPATLAGNVLTLTGQGQVTVKAIQSGNENYQAALTVTQTFCALPPKPIITAHGVTLHSSSKSGNQWYLNGELLEGESKHVLVTRAAGNYTVSVAASCGASVSDAFTVLDALISKSGIVYPNPATTQVALELPLGVTCQSARLLDAKGKEVAYPLTVGTNSVLFDISMVKKGIYMIEAQTSSGVVIHKVMVH